MALFLSLRLPRVAPDRMVEPVPSLGCRVCNIILEEATYCSEKHGQKRLRCAGKVLHRPVLGGPLPERRAVIKLCEEGYFSEAVDALDRLVHQAAFVPCTLFYHVLQGCVTHKELELGRRIHALSVKSGYGSNKFLANHIIRMYASYGSLEEATQVFAKVGAPDTFMWSAIILAHAEHGQPVHAITMYRQMRQTTVKPNNHVFVAILRACAIAADLGAGKEVHADILESVVEPDIFTGSCLVDMYAKCGSLEDARRVFDRLPSRNVVTWTAMIAGYAQHGLGREALAVYASMQQEGITPADHVTLSSLLQACASVGALHQGKQLHALVQERGLEADVVVGSCLVDMYAKCGMLTDARRVFLRLPTRNVVTWTALLNGYAEQGDSQMAIQCFEEMRQQGIQPNGFTFTCLLVACSHDGLVQEGQGYFKMMVDDHGIAPTDYHYSCMVDLLGRSGHLEEAENMLYTMPFEDDVVGWKSLLSACKSFGDIHRARRCFDHLMKLEPENASPYVVLASIYANAGRWREVERIESLRKLAGAKKKAANACIEVQNKVHEFTVGEERPDISSRLTNMSFRLKEGGHVPHTELVRKTVPEREKEDALCGHAEKLALAYGLLNTAEGTTLLVTKNLRMCNDCHSSTKIMSRLENREIIVRDSHRVHHFMDGSCSCKDRH